MRRVLPIRPLLGPKGPLLEAIDDLMPHAGAILKEWRREARGLRLAPEQLRALLDAPLKLRLDYLRTGKLAAFRRDMERRGEVLSNAGVPLEVIVFLSALLKETCWPYLHGSTTDDPVRKLALTRVFHAALLFLAVGHCRQLEASAATLASLLREAQRRLQSGGAYVTDIYERERRRLSHDLHDEIGHDLVVLKLYLEMIHNDAKVGRLPKASQKIEECLGLVSHTIDSVQRLVLDLGPAIFDELGFLPAIRFYIRKFSARTGIRVSLQEGTVPESLPSSHKTALYRVLQGALSNVLKHARASEVKVSLGAAGRSVFVMTITDNGQGFDTSSHPSRRSIGLQAMRERMEALGGRVHVESWPKTPTTRRHGTRIEVDVPVPGGL